MNLNKQGMNPYNDNNAGIQLTNSNQMSFRGPRPKTN